MITITVTGGTGTASLDFGNLSCESVSINSPDSTPNYDIAIYNQAGFFVVGAVDIIAQKAKIDEKFRLVGICQIVISGAADDGAYTVEPHPRV